MGFVGWQFGEPVVEPELTPVGVGLFAFGWVVPGWPLLHEVGVGGWHGHRGFRTKICGFCSAMRFLYDHVLLMSSFAASKTLLRSTFPSGLEADWLSNALRKLLEKTPPVHPLSCHHS